ncbi:unnamed protein product [Rotaria magnacalcarata]|uniref:Uncharacterized protein n=2 Tax=Rotaria magnacalcarata TaxID=392030 RepID=A0A819FHZ3_9BILA|nr:unnamed protein product [Rotaria magnacalcarata]
MLNYGIQKLFDIRRSDVVEEYDRDLGDTNKLTFVDRIRRIISLFDEKRICICKWSIVNDFKYIVNLTIYVFNPHYCSMMKLLVYFEILI